MENRGNGLRPAEDPDEIDLIERFWRDLCESNSTGQTSWEYLEPLRLAVADCFATRPIDLERARSLTVQAIMLIAGRIEN